MLQGLSHQAREAKSWPFEQARLLLDRILRLRLTDGERDLAAQVAKDAVALHFGFSDSGAESSANPAIRSNPNLYPTEAAMATLYTLQPLPRDAERARTRA